MGIPLTRPALPLLVITSWSNGSNQKKNLLGLEENPKQEGKDDYGCQCNKKEKEEEKIGYNYK